VHGNHDHKRSIPGLGTFMLYNIGEDGCMVASTVKCQMIVERFNSFCR